MSETAGDAREPGRPPCAHSWEGGGYGPATADYGGAGEPDPAANTAKTRGSSRRNAWGPLSYADLITQAITSVPEQRLTLAQVYEWMVANIPWFKDKGDSTSSAGWKNSVRHNLSLHTRFIKVQNEGTGKSSWWMINPDAKTGKCTRRRPPLEPTKSGRRRGRAKKRPDVPDELSGGLSGSLSGGLSGGLGQSDAGPEPAGDCRDGGGYMDAGYRPAVGCDRVAAGIGWPYPAAERAGYHGYPPPAAACCRRDEATLPPPYHAVAGYALWSGGGGFAPDDRRPTSMMAGPSGHPPHDGEHSCYNGLQVASPAVGSCPMSPHRYPPAEDAYPGQPAGGAPFVPSPAGPASTGPFSSSPAALYGAAPAGAPAFGGERPAASPPQEQSPSQLMSNLMGALQHDQPLSGLQLDAFQGGFECDVDNIIKEELSMDGSLDFAFSGSAGQQRPADSHKPARYLGPGPVGCPTASSAARWHQVNAAL